MPQFQEVTLFADGQPVHVSWSQTVDDPLLQRAEWRATVRNAIRGNQESRTVHCRVWSDYILRFSREFLEGRGISIEQGSELAYDFFFKSNANSSTGKPSRPINEFEAPYLNWPELANDIRTAVAYELIRRNIPLITVGDDVFVVEVDEENVSSHDNLADVVKSTVERVLGVEENHYGHFVELA